MAKRNDNRFEDAVAEGVLLDDPEFLRGIVERTLQQVLETQMTEHIGVERYQRGEERRGHRNGYKPREFKTRVGTLHLLVPQDREGSFSTTLFARYQRNGKALVLTLIVKGVREDGHREILAVDVADTESESSYQELFRSLKQRGLRGVQLVTSDDHKGLRAAVERHFQEASWQRCQVHFARELLGKVAPDKREQLCVGLKEVFAAPDVDTARERARKLADAWRGSHPKIAHQLEEELEECLAVYYFPTEHRVRLRSTNGLERFNQELKRRTRVVRIFPNREACLRLVTALCIEQSEEWMSRPRYLDMEKLLVREFDRTGVRGLTVI